MPNPDVTSTSGSPAATSCFAEYLRVAKANLVRVRKDQIQLTEDSRKVSEAVTGTFDELERLVDAEGERLLRDVDSYAWQELDKLQAKKLELEMILERLTNAEDVAKRLDEMSEISDSEFLPVASTLLKNLENFDRDKYAEIQTTPPPCIMAKLGRLDDIKKFLADITVDIDIVEQLFPPECILQDEPLNENLDTVQASLDTTV